MSRFGWGRPEPFADDDDDADVIGRALRTVREHLGMEVAYLSEFVDDRAVFQYVDAPGAEHLIKVGDSHALEDIYCRHILEGRLPELIADTAKEPAAMALPITRAVPIGAHLSIPVRLSNGGAYGMFCCLSSRANPSLNERDLATMRIFADLVARQVNRDLEGHQRMLERQDRIHSVLSQQAFDIVYQPIWRLREPALAGVEALCRFTGRPYRSPDIWFGEAAKTGRGTDLELMVIERALDALPRLPDGAYLSVNASPVTIASGRLAALLDGRPLARLVVEVTEDTPVADYDRLVEAMAPLRDGGARLAVDDTGTGHAGLRHLLRLVPEIIKLDLTLTRGVDGDVARRALVSALMFFGRETGAEVVAEGIETDAQLATLLSLGVALGQGFRLGAPATLDDLADVLAGRALPEALRQP
ncbi:MAG: EAL domain-containing protein [Azospirillaceae bacterium]